MKRHFTSYKHKRIYLKSSLDYFLLPFMFFKILIKPYICRTHSHGAFRVLKQIDFLIVAQYAKIDNGDEATWANLPFFPFLFVIATTRCAPSQREACVIPSAPLQPQFSQLPTPQFTRLLGFGAPTSKTQRLELEALMQTTPSHWNLEDMSPSKKGGGFVVAPNKKQQRQ